MDRTKFFLVLQTRLAGVPHNIRLETTADTQQKAINNAMYLLGKYGQDVFNVNSRAFKPHLTRFKQLRASHPEQAILSVDESDELWIKSIDLRPYVKPKSHFKLSPHQTGEIH